MVNTSESFSKFVNNYTCLGADIIFNDVDFDSKLTLRNFHLYAHHILSRKHIMLLFAKQSLNERCF